MAKRGGQQGAEGKEEEEVPMEVDGAGYDEEADEDYNPQQDPAFAEEREAIAALEGKRDNSDKGSKNKKKKKDELKALKKRVRAQKRRRRTEAAWKQVCVPSPS